MFKCLISTILIEFLLNLTPTHSACIFLNDCAIAMKYIEKRQHKPDTISILQNNHCGYETRNGHREPKVTCDQIPPFPDLPADCVRYLDCPAVAELLEQKGQSPDVIQLLRSAACSDSERRDMILCNKITNLTDKGLVRQLLPTMDECGQQIPSKIISGQATELDEFPWIALLKFKNKTGHLKYACHGSLISKRYVLTAANCFIYEELILHSVVLGEYNVSSTIDCIINDCADPIQEFSAESVLSHPNFQTQGARNDIALIRLNATATFTDFVKTICLPVNFKPLQQGDSLWIAGWGETENGTMSDVKLKAKIFSLAKNNCTEYIGLTPDDNMLCAGSNNGADSCKGDSGGPLMVHRRFNDYSNFILAGLVSLGAKCGSRAAIYTNVAKYVDWIENNIKE